MAHVIVTNDPAVADWLRDQTSDCGNPDCPACRRMPRPDTVPAANPHSDLPHVATPDAPPTTTDDSAAQMKLLVARVDSLHRLCDALVRAQTATPTPAEPTPGVAALERFERAAAAAANSERMALDAIRVMQRHAAELDEAEQSFGKAVFAGADPGERLRTAASDRAVYRVARLDGGRHSVIRVASKAPAAA